MRVAVVILDRQEQDGRARVEQACAEVGAEFVALLTMADIDAGRAQRGARGATSCERRGARRRRRTRLLVCALAIAVSPCALATPAVAHDAREAARRDRRPRQGRQAARRRQLSSSTLRGERTIGVRLFGVDCPERSQPFGARAKALSADLIGNQDVTIVVHDVDRYGRTVGDVVLADGRAPVARAAARRARLVLPALRQRPRARPPRGRGALAARRGLWSDPHPVAPWNYRKARRAEKSR